MKLTKSYLNSIEKIGMEVKCFFVNDKDSSCFNLYLSEAGSLIANTNCAHKRFYKSHSFWKSMIKYNCNMTVFSNYRSITDKRDYYVQKIFSVQIEKQNSGGWYTV